MIIAAYLCAIPGCILIFALIVFMWHTSVTQLNDDLVRAMEKPRPGKPRPNYWGLSLTGLGLIVILLGIWAVMR